MNSPVDGSSVQLFAIDDKKPIGTVILTVTVQENIVLICKLSARGFQCLNGLFCLSVWCLVLSAASWASEGFSPVIENGTPICFITC